MIVIKRDGREEEFNESKITHAISCAYRATNVETEDYSNELIKLYYNLKPFEYLGGDYITVEEIQDIIEEILMKLDPKVAKAFILYREKRRVARSTTTNPEMILDYLNNNDWKIKENSNMHYSLQGLREYMVSKQTEEFWLDYIYPKEVSSAVKDGYIHIHDLGYLASYCFTKDTRVKLLSGDDISLGELASNPKYKDGFWVYSKDSNGRTVPGWGHSARCTRKNAELVAVELDNGDIIRCTPDHPFLLKSGSYCKAIELSSGESLMPLYLHKSGGNGGEYLSFSELGKTCYLHRRVAEEVKGMLGDDEVVHHIDGNKLNNDPSNLEVMKDSDHRREELLKTISGDAWITSNLRVLTDRNKSKELREANSKKVAQRNSTDLGRAYGSYGHSKRKDIKYKEGYFTWVDNNGYVSYNEYIDNIVPDNHKVVSVTKLNSTEDVYDITVDKYHNFAIAQGVFVHNCIGWSLYDILLQGFGGLPGKTSASPPKHLSAALGQLVNFMFTLQGEAAGAQAVSSWDTLLAPFIRYDNLSYKEVKQCVQAFVYNINIPTRTGFQVPFTNITLDLQPPNTWRDEYVIIGGKPQNTKYGDYQEEMDMLNKAFAEVMLEGDATGSIFSFPIPTYNITEDFNWDNPVLNPVWEMTGKYGIPYFANFVNSDLDPEDIRSMCCRLSISNKELRKRGGGLFGANPLTGSVGVVTLNLPRMAYEANGDTEKFVEAIIHYMNIAKVSLEIKRKEIERYTDKGLYPYSKIYLQSIKDRMGTYWANHFSTIGIIGMNEACHNLFGGDIVDNLDDVVTIMNIMRDRLVEFQEETGNNYNLEATPGESTCYKLAKKDKENYPDIITAGETTPYYTNSTQLPVDYTDDIWEALEIQNELQPLYTGGTVHHIFLGERVPDIDTVKNLVRKSASKTKIPYFSISPTFSVCPDHGYIGSEVYECPDCGRETTVYSRVVGYYRPINAWNEGKQSEWNDRKEFKLDAAR